MQRYKIRKAYLQGLLEAQASKLSNQARFIVEKIDGTIKMENMNEPAIIKQLLERKFDPDPVKEWVMHLQGDFNYLVQMALIKVSKEEKDKLMGERNEKIAEMKLFNSKSPADLWREDLKAFEEALDLQEQREKEDDAEGVKKGNGTVGVNKLLVRPPVGADGNEQKKRMNNDDSTSN